MAAAAADAPAARGRGERATWPPLQKDFYLSHPDASLQCAEYCWGNLEAAHPILGERSEEEVREYRLRNGIEVDCKRGKRQAPKPFQAFSETSFPCFVEDLAYELFTSDARPFPVQAQAWPCALAGMDVIAVAPTGSGKTLAFLLPALVHVMAQEHLERGEGPIALVLQPTREIAKQTLAVARRFCERTSGEDTLRVGAAFGGVDPKLQVPSEEAPDLGRWPEILIATPGRLLDLLVKRRWLSAQRISYVVLDEADALLAPGDWLPQIQAILSHMRPDRQLLMFSATWPMEAEAAARELCGEELVHVRVSPAVPPIPQALRLFPDLDGEAAYLARKAELAGWLQRELASEEAALVLCGSRHTARELAACEEVTAAVAAAGKGGIAVLDGAPAEDERDAYQRFVHGEARVLFSSFAAGARGLDYGDTAALAAEAATPLSLVVLLFDFPPTIKDYAHCIGRTGRPGQQAGRVVAFLPEMRFWIARELSALLQHCKQPVPRELEDLIDGDRRFLVECRQAMVLVREGSEVPPEAACGGDWDASREVWVLPSALPSYRRKLLHMLADELGVPHVSAGEPRRLHMAKAREALPDKFFIEGEDVLVAPPRRGSRPVHGVVTDPRIHRRQRTVRVRFEGGWEEDVPADAVRPCAL